MKSVFLILVTCVLSSVLCLFRSLAYFKIGLFILLLLSYERSSCTLNDTPLFDKWFLLGQSVAYYLLNLQPQHQSLVYPISWSLFLTVDFYLCFSIFLGLNLLLCPICDFLTLKSGCRQCGWALLGIQCWINEPRSAFSCHPYPCQP